MLPPSTNSSTNKLIAIRKKIQKILLYKISGESVSIFFGALEVVFHWPIYIIFLKRTSQVFSVCSFKDKTVGT